jgi:hypothetical protein
VQADARLIAAAPELLCAAKLAFGELDFLIEQGETEFFTVVNALSSAIAAATTPEPTID